MEHSKNSPAFSILESVYSEIPHYCIDKIQKFYLVHHIIRIVPASENIAGYLNIFLASEYGYHLITRYTYGAVIDEIDATHVSNIPIPLLKNHDIQKRINDLALEANQKRYEAYKLEQKALEIMDREVIYAK